MSEEMQARALVLQLWATQVGVAHEWEHAGVRVCLCDYESVQAYGCAFVSVHQYEWGLCTHSQLPDALTVKQYREHGHS